MTTGLKTIDAMITRFGVRVDEGQDESQSLMMLQGGDHRVHAMRVPYCIFQKIQSFATQRTLKLHQWFLPNKKGRLATFLIDEAGNIVEQVYYPRDSRHVAACRKIQLIVEKAQRKHASVMMKLAA